MKIINLLLAILALVFVIFVQFGFAQTGHSRNHPEKTTSPNADENRAAMLIAAARGQTQQPVRYDGGYRVISYPNGDVPAETGVCTDVVIRAYRTALGIDLQQKVHQDMTKNFSLYPQKWGLKRPDTNIDHRRVPNLQIYFKRHGQSLPISKNVADYRPGDLVTQMLPGNLPHIVIISNCKGNDGTPLVIHNIGLGVREENRLFDFTITGHYRFFPA